MKKLLPILLLSSVSYALNAPYLISATALSDSSVALSWRNNDIATIGYLIQRKDSTETSYHFIDSITPATQLTYADTNGLLPTTLYTYQVIAYDSTSVSDTSNSVQVTTLAHVTPSKVFNKPTFRYIRGGLGASAVEISFFDNADCEIGYRLLRAEGLTGIFSTIRDMPSAVPDSMTNITWYDSTISVNTWYSYMVEVYKSDSSISSVALSIYTLKEVPPVRTVIFNQLGAFPLSLSGWSAKAGDSIILVESNAPSSTPFTVINVSNSSSPNFAGYIDSAAALSYPMRTLIPAYMQFNISSGCGYPFQQAIWNNNRIIVSANGARYINLYEIQMDTLAFLDSIVMPMKYVGSERCTAYVRETVPLNDSFLAVRFDVSGYGGTLTQSTYDYLYPVYLSPSGFLPLPEYRIDEKNYYFNYYSMDWSRKSCNPWIHGCWNRNILVSVDITNEEFVHDPPFDTAITWWRVFDIHNDSSSTSCELNSGTNLPFGNGYNTGRYISPTEALSTVRSSTSTTDLFVADIRDYNAYARAFTNSAVVNLSYAQTSLQNIILDTLNRHVFLIYTNYLVILGYSFGTPAMTIPGISKPYPADQLRIIPDATRSGVTIVRPGTSRTADFYFYDLRGRVVDRMLGVTSNAVLWRPKMNTLNCYIVMVKSGQEKYIKKFMVR